ncbi:MULTISPECIES: FG-GAP-like repeat-containing protein [Streptomyces]|uniref:Fusidic acid esterase FusH n=1 Tax=Streptomyces luteosporeus TaxID=173856 RepID=A0ABN3TNH0_9ACTN
MTPAQAVEGAPAKDSFQFTAKLDIGSGDTARSCSAALVEQQWLITAASCFADNPAQGFKIPAGEPKLKTTATIGRTDLTRDNGTVVDVVQLVPREDRDLVLAKLAKPVSGVTPVALTNSAPMQGEELRVAGYGRTKGEWVPNVLRSSSFTVNSVAPQSMGLAGKDADAVVCKGDTGGPAFRDIAGRQELVGVNSRSWQGGCVGTDPAETRKGAIDTRVDDLAGWISTTTSRVPFDQTIVAAGDYDGDGTTDLFTVNTARDLSVWPGRKSGLWGTPRVLTGGWNFNETVSADFNGDGVSDLVASDASKNLYMWPGRKSGVYDSRKPLSTNNWAFTQMVTGDFTGDGKADIIAVDADKTLWLWPGEGRGTFADRRALSTKNWNFTQTVAADFTGDGIADLIARDDKANLLLWTGAKNADFSRARTLTGGWNFVQTTAGEFTGDGKTDIIAKDEKTGSSYMWLWNGRGDGNFSSRVKIADGS